ncbi:hypothetical protein ACNQF7_03830 [Flavobacterium sp. RSP29]|uniref:hypothetical protein n=1 Tax=Flavobacterium sp. RSP29 TaxID=3401731 RepID=UPI003AAF1FC3
MIESFESPTLNIISTLFLIIVLVLVLFFISDFFKLIPVFRKYLVYLKNYMFIIFLIPAMSFLFIDFAFIEFKHIHNYEFIKDLCKILFSAGIFTTTLNFLDSLNVFKKNFKSIIMSEEFDNLLTQKIDALAYSQEHLNKQSNLEKIWQTVTLCKYKKEFPELYEKLENKLENHLFKKNNISYYYKNFQINYYIELIDDKYISITERASFTIIRPNKDEFEVDFKTNFNNEDDIVGTDIKFYSKNNDQTEFIEIDIVKTVDKNITTLNLSKKMSGHLEYHLESTTLMKQNINIDRIFTYGSARIIDDLTINIDHDKNINVIFVPLNGNKLYHNGAHAETKMAYINRDVLLSGEKFTMFFYRNQ